VAKSFYLKNLAVGAPDQLNWIHRPLTSRQIRRNGGLYVAADMGHVCNDDPSVLPANVDLCSRILYRARE